MTYRAVDAILGDRERGAGMFLLAHSNGCELALRMAADDRGADLLGVEISGTGLHYQAAAAEMLSPAIAGATFRPVCASCCGSPRTCIRTAWPARSGSRAARCRPAMRPRW